MGRQLRKKNEKRVANESQNEIDEIKPIEEEVRRLDSYYHLLEFTLRFLGDK